MKTYIYPQNLKATSRLWLWSIRDFSDNLSRTDSVSSNFNAAMDVSALCHYGSVCISKHSIGGNDGNRLHGLCVSVFRDRTAVILLEVRMIMKNKNQRRTCLTADIR